MWQYSEDSVTSFRTRLKKALPQPIVQSIRKIRYTRRIRDIKEDLEKDIRPIKYLVQEGDLVADIGANLGVYTKFLSLYVGPEGHVFSVEPVPATFAILKHVVRRLEMRNVEVINAAVSEQDGEGLMEIPLKPSGDDNFFEAHLLTGASESTLETVAVKMRSLDSLFGHLARPLRFVKIDVEGHELKCLKGARQILDDMHPALLLEIWGDPDDPVSPNHETITLLEEAGYRMFLFDGAALKLRRQGELSAGDNYFFFRNEHLASLKDKTPPFDIIEQR